MENRYSGCTPLSASSLHSGTTASKAVSGTRTLMPLRHTATLRNCSYARRCCSSSDLLQKQGVQAEVQGTLISGWQRQRPAQGSGAVIAYWAA